MKQEQGPHITLRPIGRPRQGGTRCAGEAGGLAVRPGLEMLPLGTQLVQQRETGQAAGGFQSWADLARAPLAVTTTDFGVRFQSLGGSGSTASTCSDARPNRGRRWVRVAGAGLGSSCVKLLI